MRYQFTILFLLGTILSFGKNTIETQGRFLRYETGDYQHAVFEDRQGDEISFWLTADSEANGVSDAIDKNTDKWLSLSYQLITQHIPEAGGDMELEVLIEVKPLNETINNLIWTTSTMQNNGEEIIFSLFGSPMPGLENIYNIHTIQINSSTLNQKLVGLHTETLLTDYYTGFIFEEMNFDGFLDFRIQEMTGTVNTPWLYFLFDKEDNQFKQTFLFDELSNPEFHSEKNLITTSWRGNAATYGEASFKFQQDQLVKISETEYEYIEEGQYLYKRGNLKNNSWTTSSGKGWEHAWSIDLTGDHIDETLYLDYRTTDNQYNGQLTITSLDNQTMWHHQWAIAQEDLVDDLLREEGNISIGNWVNHFFSGDLIYGGSFDQKKLTHENLNPDILKYSAEKIQLPIQEIKNQILTQKTNYTLFYRGSWREDVIELVYLPQLNQFIQYGTGQY